MGFRICLMGIKLNFRLGCANAQSFKKMTELFFKGEYMRKILLALAVAAVSVGMVNCGGGGSGGGSVVVSGGTTVVSKTWYDVYGNACKTGYPEPGCSYKDSGYTSDKAMWSEDPYYDYWASSEFATVWDTDYGYYVDAWGYWGVNGLFYDYYTGRAINEGATEVTKDILSVVGNREKDLVTRAGTKWALAHDLPAATGIKVAQALSDWNKIVKTRERSEADLGAFTKRALGVSLNELKEVAVTRNEAKIEGLVETAAEHWNTSPENMKKILKTIYKDELL
jgi:hypothetical protein